MIVVGDIDDDAAWICSRLVIAWTDKTQRLHGLMGRGTVKGVTYSMLDPSSFFRVVWRPE